METLWHVKQYLEAQAYPIHDWLIYKPYGDAIQIVVNAMYEIANHA